MLTRRQLLQGGIAATAIALGAAMTYEFWPEPQIADGYRFRALDDEERVILTAIMPVMLSGALPANIGASITQTLHGVDTAIAGLTPSVQKELQALFSLLRFPLTRIIATGILHPWHNAGSGEIDRFLRSWRYSGIPKLRSGYDALHQLIMASWYATPQAWKSIGYPGPPVVPH